MKNIQTGSIVYSLFIFFAAIYFLTAPGSNIRDTDAGELRFEVARSIVERFDFNIPENRGIKGIDGRDYSWVGIGSALLSVPFFLVGKLLGAPPEKFIMIINILFGAALCVIVYKFAFYLGYTARASFLTSVFFGLGTFAWPLAKQPFDHIIETFFVLLSVYSAYRYLGTNRVLYLLISASSFGFAFITRHTSVLIIPALIIMAIYYYRISFFKTNLKQVLIAIFLFSIVVLPFLALIFWYNYYRFGSIFETGYSLAAKRAGINYFWGTSILTGMSGFLISPGKGFFYYSPVAMLFFFSIKGFFTRHRALSVCFIVIMLSYLLFLSANMFWHGDWAWGPRYIFVLTPFLIIPLAGLFDSEKWMRKKFLRTTVYLVFGVSFIIQIAAVSVYFYKHFIDSQLSNKIEFVMISTEGIQPSYTPLPETYFQLRNSHLLAQFGYIYEISRKIKTYRYYEPPEDSPVIEKIKSSLPMNVFDFWWLFYYFQYGSYFGFAFAACFILLASYSLFRIRQSII